MADFWEKLANDNQSQPDSGSALADLVRHGARLADNFVRQVLAAAALEVATHGAVSGFSIGAAAPGGGANVAIAKDIARADDHGVGIADNATRSQDSSCALRLESK